MKVHNDLYDKLSKRERQIMEIILRKGEASAADVLDELNEPPSYSSVRALLSIMENKGYIEHFREGKRYIYKARVVKDKMKRSMLKNVISTFFEGSAPKAISTILSLSSSDMSEKDYKELKKLIREAEKKKD